MFGKALRKALSSYESGLSRIVAQRRITREDADMLARVAAQMGLTDKDTLPYRLSASRALFEQESHNRDWLEHDGALDSLPRLGLNGSTDRSIVSAYHSHRASRLYHRFETTGIAEPNVVSSGTIIVDPGETEILTLAASLYEEKVTGTVSFGLNTNRFTGNGSGITEYGSSLASSKVQREIVVSSKGSLHVTDRRLVFTGTPKAAGFGWRQLNGIDSGGGFLNVYVEGQTQTLILRPDRPEYCNYAHLLILSFGHAAHQAS